MKSNLNATLLLLALAGLGHTQLINPSFEHAQLSPGTFNGDMEGWTNFGQAYGSFDPGTNGAFFLENVPDGNNVGFSNGNTQTAQQSSAVLGVGMNSLSAYFGRRIDVSDGLGSLQLWAGGTVANDATVTGGTLLASVNIDESTMASGYFELFQTSYTASANDPLLGQLLTVRIDHQSGGQFDFDVVHIAAPTPEPSAVILLGLGTIALLGRNFLSSRR